MGLEEKLLVPLIETPPEPDGRTYGVDHATAELIRGAARHGCVAIGTDGGADSKGATRFRRASWGAATVIGSVGGGCQGTDTSAYAGEATALLQVMRALQHIVWDDRLRGAPPTLYGRVVVLIDNKAVVTQSRVAMGRRRLPKNTPGIWAEVRALAEHVPGLEIHWVPSHGKYRGSWKPPSGIPDGLARMLNDWADGAATHYGEIACGKIEAERQQYDMARVWVRRVMLELERRAGATLIAYARWFRRRKPGARRGPDRTGQRG